MNKKTKALLLTLALLALFGIAKYISLVEGAVEVIQEANQPLIMVYPDWGNDMSDEIWKPTQ